MFVHHRCTNPGLRRRETSRKLRATESTVLSPICVCSGVTIANNIRFLFANCQVPYLSGRIGKQSPGKLSLVDRGTTSFSSDSPGLSSKATQCSLAANRKSPELAVAIRIKSERCAPRRSARKNLCSKRMKPGFSQYLGLCSSAVTSSARNCIDLSLANPGTLLPPTAVRPTPSSLGQKSVIGTQLSKA
jgi:hypothetical protein